MTQGPPVTQAMIDLFDDFTHRSFDRRAFMTRLSQLAGGAAAAAVLPLLDAGEARADILPETDPRVRTETIRFRAPDGEVIGYLVMPAQRAGKLGGVVVIHENRGLTPHIKDVTRRIAAEGFVAMGVDFLSPLGGTPANEDAVRDMFSRRNADVTLRNGVAAVDYLAARPEANGKVGATGFCWGGGTTNRIAAAAPKALKAAVPYYGQPLTTEQARTVKASVMAHYAGIDQRINAGIPAFEQGLKAAGVPYALNVYPGAQHAFNNDSSPARFDKAVADLAWARTINHFQRTLA